MSSFDHYDSSHHMARVLASYIDCPARIQREVQTMFPAGPTLDTIRKMREQHLADQTKAPEKPDFKLHEGYYPADAYDAAEFANQRFVSALLTARAV